MVKHCEIVFKGFAAAAGIVNHNAGTAQPCKGKAHCHAVVVISFYLGWLRPAGIDGNAVLIGFTSDAHFGQLRDNGRHTITFLIADVANPCDGGGRI